MATVLATSLPAGKLVGTHTAGVSGIRSWARIVVKRHPTRDVPEQCYERASVPTIRSSEGRVTRGTTSESGMTTQIYECLLEKIQSCEYPPGAEINEKTLMEDTGFGRTPLREALHALQRDGLVEIFPR